MTELTPRPSEEVLERLRAELATLVAEAYRSAEKCRFWALLWQVTDLALGLAAAVLAAVAGATGLASTAGRVPAAIMALTAAALTAAARFLRSNERYEMNWKRVSAWQTLARDASFARAAEGYPGAGSLYNTIQTVLARRTAIMGIDHAPVPEKALGKQSVDVL
jgi:fructose-specific phosphotransferase system IIC component